MPAAMTATVSVATLHGLSLWWRLIKIQCIYFCVTNTALCNDKSVCCLLRLVPWWWILTLELVWQFEHSGSVIKYCMCCPTKVLIIVLPTNADVWTLPGHPDNTNVCRMLAGDQANTSVWDVWGTLPIQVSEMYWSTVQVSETSGRHPGNTSVWDI